MSKEGVVIIQRGNRTHGNDGLKFDRYLLNRVYVDVELYCEQNFVFIPRCRLIITFVIWNIFLYIPSTQTHVIGITLRQNGVHNIGAQKGRKRERKIYIFFFGNSSSFSAELFRTPKYKSIGGCKENELEQLFK